VAAPVLAASASETAISAPGHSAQLADTPVPVPTPPLPISVPAPPLPVAVPAPSGLLAGLLALIQSLLGPLPLPGSLPGLSAVAGLGGVPRDVAGMQATGSMAASEVPGSGAALAEANMPWTTDPASSATGASIAVPVTTPPPPVTTPPPPVTTPTPPATTPPLPVTTPTPPVTTPTPPVTTPTPPPPATTR
jgi:mucin-2